MEGPVPCLLGGSRHPEEAEAIGEHTKLEALDMSTDILENVCSTICVLIPMPRGCVFIVAYA
jgi:hypothetical protein